MRKLRERPLQIYLRPDQDTTLRTMARDQDVSLAELVRRSVDQMIAALPADQDPLMGIIGLGNAGHGDLSENHDKYLVEIYEEESKRWHAKSLSTPRRGLPSPTRKTTTTKRRKKSIRSSRKSTNAS